MIPNMRKKKSSIVQWGLVAILSTSVCLAYANNAVENFDCLIEEILKDDCFAVNDNGVKESQEESASSKQNAMKQEEKPQGQLMADQRPSSPSCYVQNADCNPCYADYGCCPEYTACAPCESRWSRFVDYCNSCSLPSCKIGSRSHMVYPYLRGTAGRGIGIDHDYTTIGAMYSTLSGDGRIQPFIDAKWHNFSNRNNAVNAGIGVRYLSSNCKVAYGLNAYYDYRDGCYQDFHQFGVGMEVLSKCFEFRVNGYFPFQRDGCSHRELFCYPGDYWVTCQRCQFSLRGADAEAGAVLLNWRCFRVLLAAGAYYYNNDFNDHALGARGHLNIRFRQYVGFDLYATTDKVFRNRIQGQFYISLPFSSFCGSRQSCCGNSPLCCVANYPVYRNDMIVLKHGCCWGFNFDDQIDRVDDSK